MKSELHTYYSKRAGEYERIYEKPERQGDLSKLKEVVRSFFASHVVLEVACGTGYWTQIIAETATSVTAIDISDEVLEIARGKRIKENVKFAKVDAFDLNKLTGRFTAVLAAFWYSHIRREEVGRFFKSLHNTLMPDGITMLIDNRYVAGSSTQISDTDSFGNMYQKRKLNDGTEHRVLKNFPTRHELRQALGNEVRDFQFCELPFYWYAAYRVKKQE